MPEVDEQIKAALLETAEDLRTNASAAWAGLPMGPVESTYRAADWVTDRANNP